ncbi:MAG: serine hydrolase [Blastocatellia bacterium]|nr:serine hydrolase [Blastocatellia bacterium]
MIINKTKIFSACLVIFTLSLITAAGALVQESTPVTARLDEYMSAAAKQGFTGSVLVGQDGKVIFSKGYGMANEEWNIPNTPQTKFRLGSITKQFTATAILLLQERGKLSVQDPICKYVSECPQAWEPITIHHLLTHTSGIPSYTDVKSPEEYRKLSLSPVTVTGFVDSFKSKPLEFAPGEKWKYDNSGYFLLGYIIEKVSGQSYEKFLQDNIFTPLKLADTGYDTHDRIIKHRATGYSFRNNTRINSDYLDMTVPYSAGSLYSTVEDLFAWNEALFSDKLLTAKSREAMMTVYKNNYAYGLGVNQQFNRKMVSHGGGINGFNTALARFPEEKLTIVVLRNADYGYSNPGQIGNNLAAIVLGEKYEIPKEHIAIKVDPKIYDAYVGEYELAPNAIFKIRKEGERLMVTLTGQPEFELFPESETKFFYKVVDAQITFVKDDKGAVTHLILHQGGDRTAKKIK